MSVSLKLGRDIDVLNILDIQLLNIQYGGHSKRTISKDNNMIFRCVFIKDDFRGEIFHMGEI